VVPLYQSVLSGLLIGLKGEIGGSLRVCLNNTNISEKQQIAYTKLCPIKSLNYQRKLKGSI